VIPATGKAFDLEFAQTSKWAGEQLIVISAFWDSAAQRQQIGPRRSERRRPVREGATDEQQDVCRRLDVRGMGIVDRSTPAEDSVDEVETGWTK
jgi:hypothetical protein